MTALNANINITSKDGYTPVIVATRNGHTDAIKALASLGANVNTPQRDGITPMFIAALNGYVDVIRALSISGGDVNTPDHYGVTPIFIAAKTGHAEAIKALAAMGGDINAPDKHGVTPVFVAATQCHGEVIKVLYRLGADMGISVPGVCVRGLNILETARALKNPLAIAYIEKIVNKIHSICEYCGCYGRSNKRLFLCGNCEKVRYCSIECKNKDYKKHKHDFQKVCY